MSPEQTAAFLDFLDTLDADQRAALLDALGSRVEDDEIAAEIDERDLSEGERFIVELSSHTVAHITEAA